jgi:hypothetical protein
VQLLSPRIISTGFESSRRRYRTLQCGRGISEGLTSCTTSIDNEPRLIPYTEHTDQNEGANASLGLSQKQWLTTGIKSFLQTTLELNRHHNDSFSRFKENAESSYRAIRNNVMAASAFITSIVLGLRSVGVLETSFMSITILAIAIGILVYVSLSIFIRKLSSILDKVEAANEDVARKVLYILGYVHGRTLLLQTITFKELDCLAWYVSSCASACDVPLLEVLREAAESSRFYPSIRRHLLADYQRNIVHLRHSFDHYESMKGYYTRQKNFLAGLPFSVEPLLKLASEQKWKESEEDPSRI